MHEDERISKFLPLMQSLYGAARENLGFKPHAKICIVKSGENMKNPLGKTAYYSPTEHKIGLYTQGRHIKDILRSLAHELVHHNQNCRGDFEQSGGTMPGYAQEDGHLREMEREAYECGNMIFRDWEDNLKEKGARPLFTSTSQYVPAPTSDVVSSALFERNQMNERIDEKWYNPATWGKKKDPKKPYGVPKAGSPERLASRKKALATSEKKKEFMQTIQSEYSPEAATVVRKIKANYPSLENEQECAQYNEKIKNWAKKYKIKEEHRDPFLGKCDVAGKKLVKRGYTPGQHTWTAIQRAARENQNYKTTNLLFEGDKKMNKKVKISELRTIVRGLIRETVLGMNVGSEAERQAAEEVAPWEIGEGTAMGEFDETDPEQAAWETPEESLYEDTEGEETYHYGEDEGEDKNRLKDDDLSPEHANALRKDMEYDEEHEDRNEPGTRFTESFFPESRSIREKARFELNEALTKRWAK